MLNERIFGYEPHIDARVTAEDTVASTGLSPRTKRVIDSHRHKCAMETSTSTSMNNEICCFTAAQYQAEYTGYVQYYRPAYANLHQSSQFNG